MKIKIRLTNDIDDDGNLISASKIAEALAVSCGGTYSTSGHIAFIECDESQDAWLIQMVEGDDRIAEYEVIE